MPETTSTPTARNVGELIREAARDTLPRGFRDPTVRAVRHEPRGPTLYQLIARSTRQTTRAAWSLTVRVEPDGDIASTSDYDPSDSPELVSWADDLVSMYDGILWDYRNNGELPPGVALGW